MFAVLVTAAAAQEGPPLHWAPVLEVRPRVVVADVAAAALRTRLGVELSRHVLTARVVVQDVRGWDAFGAVSYGATPSLAEGWARIDWSSENLGLVVQVGRQPLEFGGGRVVGRRDWGMVGQFFDAASVKLIGAPLTLQYVNARHFEATEPLGPALHLVRLGAGRAIPGTTWNADAVACIDATEGRTLTTLGAFGTLEAGRFRGRAEGWGQSEDRETASLVAGSAGWVFGREEGVVVHGRGETVSGGAAPWQRRHGDVREFEGLLGAPGDAADGRVDLEAILELRASARLETSISVRHDWSADLDRSLAWTAEAEARWFVSPFAAVGAGGAGRKGASGEPDAAMGYVELDAAF